MSDIPRKRVTSPDVDCPVCGAPKRQRCRGSAYSGRSHRTVDYHYGRREVAQALTAGYVDSRGQPVLRGDLVTVPGCDYKFRVESIRPERVAVIKNLTIDAVGTSSIELSRVVRCRFPAEHHPHTGECPADA